MNLRETSPAPYKGRGRHPVWGLKMQTPTQLAENMREFTRKRRSSSELYFAAY